MSKNTVELLEDRLERRRCVRKKRLLRNNPVNELEVILINQSSTTQSLDRKSSKRITAVPSIQPKSSPSILKSPRLPSIEKSYSKPNPILSDYKTTSTPILSQVVKHQSSDSDYDQSIPSTALVTPILPPVPQETRRYSNPNRWQNSDEHPSSHSQSTTDHQHKQFHYPHFHSARITRTISEQIVSITKSKHQPVDSPLVKQNSLALPYLFHKSLIDMELARASSLDSKELHNKTVWD